MTSTTSQKNHLDEHENDDEHRLRLRTVLTIVLQSILLPDHPTALSVLLTPRDLLHLLLALTPATRPFLSLAAVVRCSVAELGWALPGPRGLATDLDDTTPVRHAAPAAAVAGKKQKSFMMPVATLKEIRAPLGLPPPPRPAVLPARPPRPTRITDPALLPALIFYARHRASHVHAQRFPPPPLTPLRVLQLLNARSCERCHARITWPHDREAFPSLRMMGRMWCWTCWQVEMTRAAAARRVAGAVPDVDFADEHECRADPEDDGGERPKVNDARGTEDALRLSRTLVASYDTVFPPDPPSILAPSPAGAKGVALPSENELNNSDDGYSLSWAPLSDPGWDADDERTGREISTAWSSSTLQSSEDSAALPWWWDDALAATSSGFVDPHDSGGPWRIVTCAQASAEGVPDTMDAMADAAAVPLSAVAAVPVVVYRRHVETGRVVRKSQGPLVRKWGRGWEGEEDGGRWWWLKVERGKGRTWEELRRWRKIGKGG
ncbi:hypothetical protein HDU96_011142 [Phlyctochytrium bullatum]|nr:hypothetical protein HDU96_011142 [Phlyctochytrium bullatum]